ncbi:MAG TPA: 5-formyltetrahydrofolate cyclo-ligase [Hadesarchaea archaeon]|nr:5-formyltetrahydrofolate cyclo-ligase [Hadesarchaea archaeon]
MVSAEKTAIREKYKSLRKRLSREEVLAKSRRIKKLLFELPEFDQAKTVAFYVAKRESHEVETEEMIKETLKLGKRVLVPVVDGAKILFSDLRDYDSELAPGTFGVPEPKPLFRRPVPVSESDLIVVPGVAFDCRGYRLGYGGGYYDRLLREASLTRPSLSSVGLGYELQIVEKLPVTAEDVPVDILVTEKRVLRF